MKKQYQMRITVVTIFCLLFCGTGVLAQVAVIAHKSVPEDSIKKNELLDFYTGDIKKWSNGVPVVVLDLKLKCEAKNMFYKFLGKSSSRMKSIWLKKMLSGEGDPPKSLKSEEEMLNKVASTPGAIGFVSQTKVSREVKTLILIQKKKK